MHEYNTPQALQLPVANKSRPAAVAKSVIVVRDGARDAARAATAGREQIEAARSSQAADRMRIKAGSSREVGQREGARRSAQARDRESAAAPRLPVANKSRPAAAGKWGSARERAGARPGERRRPATAGREQIEASSSREVGEREGARRRATGRAPPPRDCRSRTNRGQQQQGGRAARGSAKKGAGARPGERRRPATAGREQIEASSSREVAGRSGGGGGGGGGELQSAATAGREQIEAGSRSGGLGWCEAINGGDGGGGGGGDRWDPRAGEQAMAMATTGNGWWGKGARTSTGMSTARVKQKLLEADISEGAALVSNNNIPVSHLQSSPSERLHCRPVRPSRAVLLPRSHLPSPPPPPALFYRPAPFAAYSSVKRRRLCCPSLYSKGHTAILGKLALAASARLRARIFPSPPHPDRARRSWVIRVRTLFTPTAHADLGLSAFGTPLSNTNGVLYSPVAMDSPTITPASRGATTSLPGSPVGLLDAGGASPNEPGTEAPEGSRCPSPDETGTASSDGDDHSMSTLTDISDDEEEARAELAPSSSSGTPARPRISPSIGASGEDCETDLAAMRAPANSSAPERNNPSEPVAREKTMIECWWGPCHMAELLTMYERHLVPCQYPLSREEASRYPPGDMFVFAAGKQLDFFRTLPKSKYSSDVSWSVY
ncbi:hypothetical protein BD626DRAFT_537761 [Schizophyllum amplum]|uniref:Uncharacterized protein n=1 Tax=Schizophyllum amplum TaxID=97359 RepID=A0A550CB08_9AGAR|nr:hypothetical protein BD626DRAFT_537761 [Auriculariopsis ampla]